MSHTSSQASGFKVLSHDERPAIDPNFMKVLHHDTYPAINPKQWNMRDVVVLIIGASRGIGVAIGVSFARAGASGIAIAARSSKDLADVEATISAAAKDANRAEPKVLKLVLDVSDIDTISASVKATEDTFGRLDILVNNAGFMEKYKLIVDSDPAEWWKTFELNLRGPYLVTRAFLPLLLKSDGGLKVILNVASNALLRVDPTVSAYEISKFALVRLTEFIQAEYAHKGVTAIAAHPGAIKTAMWDKNLDVVSYPNFQSPELPGDTIVWLTKERREWLNGRYVDCLWDVEELESKKADIVEGNKLKFRLVV